MNPSPSPTLSGTPPPLLEGPFTSADESQDDLGDPLVRSLLAVSSHPDCPSTAGFFDGVPEINQPRRLASALDSADYFVDAKGEPLVLVFPAELDFLGRYSRCGPYFNLPDNVESFFLLVCVTYSHRCYS
jgi:hypothetical protein